MTSLRTRWNRRLLTLFCDLWMPRHLNWPIGQSERTKTDWLTLYGGNIFRPIFMLLTMVSFLFAANVLQGVAVEVVGRRPDEPSELVALTNKAIIFYVDVTFLIRVDLNNSELGKNLILNNRDVVSCVTRQPFQTRALRGCRRGESGLRRTYSP